MTEPAGAAGGDEGTDLRSIGDRVQGLLDASSSGGPVARERAEELVRLVVELYGAGIERMLHVLHEVGRLDDVALDALTGDELVASLLLVHGLHPEGITDRVERALEEVRPYLGSHGGDVELIGVSDDGVVRIRLLGSCDGCASSTATLTLAVEGAIRDAAPEVSSIEVDAPTKAGLAATPGQHPNTTLIPVEALYVRRKAATDDGAQWLAVPGLDDLSPGELRTAMVADVAIIICRAGGDLFAFRDGCPSCGTALDKASVERRLGGTAGDAILRCAGCGSHYDVRHAGASTERSDEHLDPLPLLTRRGAVEVALPRSVNA